MAEQNRQKLSIRRKPKVYVNPKLVDKRAPQPQKPAKQPKVKASSPVKEPKPKQVPPKPLSRAERLGRNPKTGEKITIPAARVPAFRAGKALK